MLTNKELLLVYLVVSRRLKEMFHPKKEASTKEPFSKPEKSAQKHQYLSPELENLDREARQAVQKLLEVLGQEPLNYTKLGRIVRHGAYNNYTHSLFARYFNVYSSRADYRLERKKNVQDVMQMLSAAVPGKTFDCGQINNFSKRHFHTIFDLIRSGKLRLGQFRPDGHLTVIPQIPVQNFDTPKGVFEYKSLQVSMKFPYVSYHGRPLKFKKNSFEFKILKELVKKQGEGISSFDLYVTICKNKNNTPLNARQLRVKSRIESIRKKLPTGCPQVSYDKRKDLAILK